MMLKRTAYGAEIAAAAATHGLDPVLVESVVIAESSGRTDAFRYEPGFYRRYLAHKPAYEGKNPLRVSSSYGLCQCMYTTALEVGFPADQPPELLFVPEIGLDYGCRFLKSLLDWAAGDVTKALCAYNGGRGSALKPPYPNQKYADRVLSLYASAGV